MSILDQIRAKAHTNLRRIVFPEGEEPRTVKAAEILSKEQIALPVLLGSPDRIRSLFLALNADYTNIEMIDPAAGPKASSYTSVLYNLRKAKGLSEEDARRLVSDPMYYGILMVHEGDADGLVSGASHTTGDMLRPALQVIKTKPGIDIVSSSMLMEFPNPMIGHQGLLLFADCVVNPAPTARQLAQIAVSSADTARQLCGIGQPKVALLSFSTKGSARHELVEKVQEATAIAHEIAPELLLDGELQFDAAILPDVGRSKAPESAVAGQANVLIFPDLQAGNIGYKIAQRLGGANAVAVLQGLAKPCNDLSRGCSVEDIVTTAAITAVQSMDA